MSDKIYCGNGKVITTQHGPMLKLSFSEDDLKKLVGNLDRGWVNAVVHKRREPSDKGLTHYLTIDTWKPNKEASAVKDEPGDDLPF